MPSETTPLNQQANGTDNGNDQPESSFRKMTDLFFQPFSSGALSKLPTRGEGSRTKAKRADRIPDEPHRPSVSEYHSINDPTIRVRVPKKIATPVKVEAKVWFANERTFISYLSMGLLLSTISSGLLFGARDGTARYFAITYAGVSAAVLIYGYVLYQRRLTMISARDAGSFDTLLGPLLICAALFIAILANFIFRLRESHKHTGVNPMSFQNAWYEAGVKSSWVGK